MRLLLILFGSLMLGSCIVNVLDISDRYEWKNGKLVYGDRNRRIFLTLYESTLAQEARGQKPPPAVSSWDSYWSKIFRSLQNGDVENPNFYIKYIKGRRTELGLPR